MVTKVIRFIKRLFYYMPVIWKDEDWDYESIYYFLKYKLKRLQKAQEQDALHTDSDKYAKQIKTCLGYLDRYLHWVDYVDYPIDDIIFTPAQDNLLKMTSTSSRNQAIRNKFLTYEDFNNKMFWKKFIKWHQNWWC